MSIEVLDPTHEADFGDFAPAGRLKTLEGAAVGILSNGKQGTDAFFDAFEKELVDTHRVAKVVRLTKANYSAPAEPAVWEQAAGLDAIVAGVGD